MRKWKLFFLAYSIGPALGFYWVLNPYKLSPEVKLAEVKSELTGKELSMHYCQMCHAYPQPNELDKKTWETGVLPNMGMRLGIRGKENNPYAGMNTEDIKIAKQSNVFPATPLIPKQDWDKIVDFYLQSAPQVLPSQKKTSLSSSGNFPFVMEYISLENNNLPQVTLLKYNQNTGDLYVGDHHTLYVTNNKGVSKAVWNLSSPASNLEFLNNEEPLLTTIGSLMPSDKKLGALSHLSGSKAMPLALIDSLRRPVHFALGDVNEDGRSDVVIASFGNHIGKLSWFDNLEKSKEQVLNYLPGARMVVLKDFNGDNKPDIAVLMAQAQEQILIYYNMGQGQFREKSVLQLPAIHGSSHMEVLDFNGDGYLDLVLANGDNKDYSSVDKPYHGIRIYLNDGDDNFNEAYFYPMYECYKAVARDFDGDGDLDIVAASLYVNYSDLKDLKESFVFLENIGNLKFVAHHLPEEVHGKWLTMEVGDFNEDNLLDVMLGTYIDDFSEMGKIMVSSGVTSFPQLLVLTQLKLTN
jgi:hypothetical protein